MKPSRLLDLPSSSVSPCMKGVRDLEGHHRVADVCNVDEALHKELAVHLSVSIPMRFQVILLPELHVVAMEPHICANDAGNDERSHLCVGRVVKAFEDIAFCILIMCNFKCSGAVVVLQWRLVVVSKRQLRTCNDLMGVVETTMIAVMAERSYKR